MTRQAGLHAKFTGDASGLASASKLAAFELNKVRAAQSAAKKEAEAAANSTEAFAKKLHSLRMETDGAYAAMDRFRRAAALVTAAQEKNVISAEAAGAELQRLARHYGVAEAAGFSMNEQIRASRFHTANMAAQFNDIGVMMASGQSPFVLALQQGTQLNQILADMGGTARERFRAIGSSIMSVVSPANLLTLGLIAGAAALVQWVMAASDSGSVTDQFAESVDTLISRITAFSEHTKTAKTSTAELAEEFGKYALAVRKHNEYLAQVELGRALTEARKAMDPLMQGLEQVTIDLARVAEQKQLLEETMAADNGTVAYQSTIQELQANLQFMERELQKSASAIGVIPDEAERLIKAFQVLRTSNSMEDIALAADTALKAIQRMEGQGQLLSPTFAAAASELVKVLEAAAAAQREAEKLANTAPGEGWMSVAVSETNSLISKLIQANNLKNQLAGISGGGKVPSGLGKEVDILFGNVPPGLGGAPNMPTSIRPQAAPTGEGGVDWGAPADAGGGGGGAAANAIQRELEALQNSLLTQEELEIQSYERRKEVLDQALNDRLITQESYQKMMEQVNDTHQFKMLQSTNRGVTDTLSALGSLFQGSKKIGAAIAVANSWIAFTEVLKDPAYATRPWARIAAASKVLAAGLNAVRNIKSANPGSSAGAGGVGGGGEETAAASPPQQQVQTLNFSIQNDPFGFGSRIVREFVAQLNEAQRNGNTLIQATVS